MQQFRRLSSNFLTLVIKIQVSSFFIHGIFLAMAQAFYYRGRCYMHMQEYKRALYDFSAAIRAESKKDNDPIKLGDYYMYAGQCN